MHEAANSGPADEVRLAELIAALSLALDLGMGQPLEQALRTCLLSVRLAERVGLGGREQAQVYYVALLRFLGCTADAHETAAIVGGDELAFRAMIAPVLGAAQHELLARAVTYLGRDQGPLQRAQIVGRFLRHGAQIREGARAHCELAEHLAARLGLDQGVRLGLAHALERWDGAGRPQRLAGEAISLAARIVSLMRDVEVLSQLVSPTDLFDIVRQRRGAAYDPALVEALERAGPGLLDQADASAAWPAVLAAEPRPRRTVPAARLDEVLAVFADFVDLKSPFTLGHSRGVATLAAQAAPALGLGANEAALLRRAGLVHDLGRVGVASGIWDKPGPLSAGEWERVRLHPYSTERILARATPLAPLAVASLHHERLDGSGYHRGLPASAQPLTARVLAAADVYHALTEPRAYRPALAPAAAAQHLAGEVAAGRLDRSAVDAVLAAAGQAPAPARRVWPLGLSEREVEVLRLLCRGATKRQIAGALHIAPSTADHHVRHIYTKLDVSTRAGAAVVALEHRLLEQ
ncbi:MAG: HD domain-containing phosphohydrolase [Thermomicrobiales bacterium]